MALWVCLIMAVSHCGCFLAHHLAADGQMRGCATVAQNAFAHGGMLWGCHTLGTYEGVTLALQAPLVILLLVGYIKQMSFLDVSALHRHLAAADSLTHHLAALSEAVGFEVGAITGQTYGYFLAAPTLIFQTAYPRAATNWRRVARLAAELATVHAVCGFISLCWLLPHLEANQGHITTMDLRWGSFSLHIPTLIGAAIPNTITWVLGVGYGVFHLALNVVAELTGFGDRTFFGPWWRAADFKAFW
jgi:hypothetical protein